VTATPGRDKPNRAALAVVLLLIVAVVGVAGSTYVVSRTVQHLPFQREFCFAEWCVTPTAYRPGPGSAGVAVHVRSDAKAATQRPDHPQAWLVEQSGALAGGPQAGLDRAIGPGQSYDLSLVFADGAGGACPRFLVSEGGWPPFLGLGYAPSPFTERVDWPLCR
jgi:hypothetical protein